MKSDTFRLQKADPAILPYLQRPLEFGADLVMHSASKYLGGHADVIAGVLATSHHPLFKELKTIQRYRGATPSPFDCYLLERSLQTLEVSPIQSPADGLGIISSK